MYLPYKIYYNYIFQHVFPLEKSLDLSSSKLTRQIPKEVMSLVGLKNLNLSTNLLVRPIPPNIAEMRELESLDLSRNHLSFTIPPDMTNLTFIVVLDVSHNNLSGVILVVSCLIDFITHPTQGILNFVEFRFQRYPRAINHLEIHNIAMKKEMKKTKMTMQYIHSI